MKMELQDRQVTHTSTDPLSKELTSDEVRGLAPPDYFDPVIEAYKHDIDRTLLIENLHRTVPERLANFQRFMNDLGELRGAALSAAKHDASVRHS